MSKLSSYERRTFWRNHATALTSALLRAKAFSNYDDAARRGAELADILLQEEDNRFEVTPP